MEAHSGSRRKIRQSPLGGLPLQTSTAGSPGITSRNFNTCFFNLKLQAPLSSFLTVTNNKPVHVIFLKPRNVGIFLQARSQRKGRNNHGHRVRGVSFALEVQAVLKTMGGGRGAARGLFEDTLQKASELPLPNNKPLWLCLGQAAPSQSRQPQKGRGSSGSTPAAAEHNQLPCFRAQAWNINNRYRHFKVFGWSNPILQDLMNQGPLPGCSRHQLQTQPVNFGRRR